MGGEWKEKRKDGEGAGRNVVGREGEMDESGETEREIVKPLRENVAENGLFGCEGSLVSGLNGENRGANIVESRIRDAARVPSH